MSIPNLGNFPHTIGNLDDRPNLTAEQMKEKFEHDVMTLWATLAECIPSINDILPASRLVDIVNSSSTDSGVPTAKAVYDAIADASLGGSAQQIIDDWLDAHPEATTTVQDGSITNAKLSTSFVTPGLASAYSSSSTYGVGDYVFYNGALYRCITAITTAEIWNADHWSAASIGVDMGDVLKSVIEEMDLDTSRLYNGFVSTTIGSAVYYSSSTKTISYDKIVKVYKGKHYTIYIENSSSPAASSSRDSCIIDNDRIVRQVLRGFTTTAGETTEYDFYADIDGYLCLSVDANYVSIKITGAQIYNDVEQQDIKFTKFYNDLKNKCIINNELTVPSGSAVADGNDVVFKANHTYVIVILDSNLTTGGCSLGISNTSYSSGITIIDGMDVIKFKMGDSDVQSHLWFYNGTSASKNFKYVCEEWDDRDIWSVSEPGTVRVAAQDSVPMDKYLSKYICDGTDDQVEIQAAINDLPLNGGKVLLSGGKYYVTSLRDTEDAEIGYIGIEITRPDTFHSVTIEGVGKPIRQSAYGIGLAATINLTSSALSPYSTSQHITLIGALPVDNELQREARALNLTIKNIGINIARNDMSIKCIDAEYCSALEIENVCIGVSGVVGDLPFPNPNCIGIRGLGKWNYGIYYIMKCVKIAGMGVAFDLGGEHLIMEQCAVRYSDIPYRFYKYGDVTGMAHSNTLINCCEEFCAKSFVFGAISTHPNISIIDYTIEWRYDDWGRVQKAIEEHPGDICGRVNFSIDHVNYTNTSEAQFWESGSGINVRTINNTDLLKGDTAHRPPYPNLMQQYYDTTVGKLITYNGTDWVY